MTQSLQRNYHNHHLLEMAKERLMLEEFLIRNSNLDVRDEEDRNILYWTIKNRSRHNTAILLKYNIDLMVSPNIHAIFHAIASGDIDIFLHIIESKNIDLDMQNNDGETLLMRAIENQSIQMVRYLINHGSNLHLANNHGAKAIDYAKKSKNRAIFDLVHYRILYKSSEG